jgi:hypothetical protein
MEVMRLTREEAIKEVGIEAVEAVESLNCEPTNRVGYNGNVQGDDTIEWSATYSLPDESDYLTAYYYTDADETDSLAEATGGDLSGLGWVVDHYEIG